MDGSVGALRYTLITKAIGPLHGLKFSEFSLDVPSEIQT